MTSKVTPRVDYDQIAHLYDQQPYRQKEVDPDLLALLNDDPDREIASLCILDMGCGTGTQLVANRSHFIGAQLIGMDLFYSMLRQAQAKADSIFWVQADSANPPFPSDYFDFISNQFSFHHVQNKPAMLQAVFRMLKAGGRFVMTNVCPHEMTNWLYYHYFPAALEADFQDFLPNDVLLKLMKGIGFVNIDLELEHAPYEQDLGQFLEIVQRRDTCSQLITIPDADYQAGVRQLEMELQQAGNQPLSMETMICLLTMRAEK